MSDSADRWSDLRAWLAELPITSPDARFDTPTIRALLAEVDRLTPPEGGAWTAERDQVLVERIGRTLMNAPAPAPGQRMLATFAVDDVQDLRAAYLAAARLAGSLELALADTERERDAAMARVAALEAELDRWKVLETDYNWLFDREGHSLIVGVRRREVDRG